MEIINIIIAVLSFLCGSFILIIIFHRIASYIYKVYKLNAEKAEFKNNGTTDNAIGRNNTQSAEQPEDLFYEEVENEQIPTVSRTIQRKNCEIPNQNLETIPSQSNERYLYTVPDDEEPSLNQAPEDNDCMKAYMYI